MVNVSPTLAENLADILELRPFPAAASQLIAACDNADATAKELSEIIRLDPALSLKLLQLANSPMYGFSGEIRSVDHASVVLGMRALRDLAISVSVSDAFATGSCVSAPARKELWLHSMACGVVSRTLATILGLPSPDEAFLGGVVHDVGKLFFFDHSPEQYLQAISIPERSRLVSVETETFGIAHPSVGEKCGQQWGLPDEINDIICFHHNPLDSDFNSDVVKTVAAANQLCRDWIDSTDEDAVSVATETLDSLDLAITSQEISSFYSKAISDVNGVLEAYGK